MEYIYGTQAQSPREMADMIAPYIGRVMRAQVWTGKAVRPHTITLVAVGGTNVAFWFNGTRFVRPVEDVFGHGMTTVLA